MGVFNLRWNYWLNRHTMQTAANCVIVIFFVDIDVLAFAINLKLIADSVLPKHV